MVAKIFDEKQIDFITDNYENYTYKQMSELDLFIGLNEKQIRNKARSLGIKKNRVFNNRFFEEIDTGEKAYWLGFIYADGYVVYNKEKSNYELGIGIHSKDDYILKNLNFLLGDMHNIIYRKRNTSFNGYDYISDICELRVYSKKICEDLIKHSVLPNKTKENVYPIIEDEKLFFHFLRGFMDGDGCLHRSPTKKILCHFTNSNPDFFNYLKDRLSLLGIHSKIYKEKDLKYRLYLNTPNTQKLLNKIYNDSNNLKLIRKYQIYVS